MSDDVVLGTLDSAAIVPAGPRDDSAAAVAHYIEGQLSVRSRQNARDALRRIARVVLDDEGADEFALDWPKIDYEKAQLIRRRLFDRTVVEEITPGTANLTLSHLRGIVLTMHAMGIVRYEQLAITHPRVLKNVRGSRDHRGTALSPDQEKELRAAARDLGPYRGAMLDSTIVLAVGTGMRREEVANASLDGLQPGMLRLIGKGNKERRAPLDDQVQAAVDDWLDERARLEPGHANIFCSPQRPEQLLSKWSLWSLVREASHLAFGDRDPCAEGCRCLEVVTGPHDFRRTFATRLFEHGYDIREVQRLMGHESPDTTARYDKRDEKTLFEKRRKTKVIA